MRLLVAAERLGPLGGMERALGVLLPALAARGAQVRVIARTIAAPANGLDAVAIPWADEHDPPDPAAAHAVRAVIRAFAPAAALAANVMDAGVVAALRAVPRVVYQVHDHRPFCPNGDRRFPRTGANCTHALGGACVLHALTEGCVYGPRPRTLRLLRRRQALRDAIAGADAVAAASRYVADLAQRSGIDAARVHEIPVPLPDDAFASPVVEAPAGTVAFAGRVVAQKGLLSLVRAIGRIDAPRRPRLDVYGDGPALAEAAACARRLDVALTAFGNVDPAAVRDGFDRATVAAVPSLWAEPFGLAGIEAHARGRAVVAYDTGGIDAWLRDGRNGLAVPLGDEAALARAIASLLDDDALRTRLATQGRADAERFRRGPAVDALWALLSGA